MFNKSVMCGLARAPVDGQSQMSDDEIIEYVFELPTKCIYKLGDLLDSGNLWEDVGKQAL